jgi:hypothetical protein
MIDHGTGDFAARLSGVVEGDVLFDAASRGRYATDASIYQVEPIGVLVPKSTDDVRAAIALCRQQNVPLLPRGAGSSQCGQTVGAALVIDHSKHLDRIGVFDREAMTIDAEPGVVLDQLNAHAQPHGVWFPSTSARRRRRRSAAWPATIRADRARSRTATWCTTSSRSTRSCPMAPRPFRRRARDDAIAAADQSADRELDAIGARERSEIERNVPKVLRRVGGYNIDVFHPQSERPYTADGSVNYAQLLVGSEGTLAWTRG